VTTRLCANFWSWTRWFCRRYRGVEMGGGGRPALGGSAYGKEIAGGLMGLVTFSQSGATYE
jgi:hypothetical protein